MDEEAISPENGDSAELSWRFRTVGRSGSVFCGLGVGCGARLFLQQAFVLAAVKEYVASEELAALHAGVARQIVYLAAQALCFVWATPSATGHSGQLRYLLCEGRIVRRPRLGFKES